MVKISESEFERIIADPSAVYQHPDEVLKDDRLSHLQKIIVLKGWAYDAREIEVAQAENMQGEPSHLRTILLALDKLEKHPPKK